ncbi:WYL domain-containing protein [Paenibacillus sp. JTLBN-2024]
MKELIEAAVGRRIVCMTYRSKSGARTRNAVPIGVYANDGLWYMPACDVDKGNVRLFRVDRIQSLQISDETYEVHTGLMEWLGKLYGIFPCPTGGRIDRRGHAAMPKLPLVRSGPLGKGLGNRAAGKIDTVIDRGDVGYTAAFFAGLGKEAKVLEPQEVIDLIRAHAETLLHQYSQV